MSRPWLVAASAAFAAAIVALLLWSEPPADPIRPGQTAPAFELPLLDGSGTISLETLRGRVVLINFWATWCAPCEAEMPAMQRLHEALANADFTLVAVSVDAGRAEVEAFQKRLALGFPIALDPDKRVATEYQSHRFPESYLVDRDGKILSRYVGPREWDAPVYVERIRRVIAGGGAGAAPE